MRDKKTTRAENTHDCTASDGKPLPNRGTYPLPDFLMSILSRLKKAHHKAYVVGGAVRDMCINRPVTDWDVATSAPAQEIKKIFRNERLFSLKHDTVTILDREGMHFDLTPFKNNAEDITGDLLLRDFTINAMAISPCNRGIIDPANGLMDVKRKLIRATGNPYDRFREDNVRILRAIRLAVDMNFKIEEDTFHIMKEMSNGLSEAAPERLRDELNRILVSPAPSRAFALMFKAGIVQVILPELAEGYRKAQNEYHRYTIYKHIMLTVDQVIPSLELRWAALLHDIAKPRVRKKKDGRWVFHAHEVASAEMAEDILKRFRFGKEITRRVVNLVRHHFIDYDYSWSDAAIRRLVSRVGKEQISNLLELRKADLKAHGTGDSWRPLMEDLGKRISEQLKKRQLCTDIKDLAINGNTVMEHLGIPPSPEVGRILSRLRDMVISNPEINTKEQLIAMLHKLHD